MTELVTRSLPLRPRLDKLTAWVARRMPRRLRYWAVITAGVRAASLHPTTEPDTFTFKQWLDGAIAQQEDTT